ncbi:MAG: hypothetical protein K2Q03_07300 [Sphingobacteriaceae bacterium]|nr:hypothetical protein [Sphingobacteriaceae bacterium]
MDLQTRKLEIIKHFLNLQNEDMIARVENLLKNDPEFFKNKSLEPFTVDEFNTRINKSLSDSKKDNGIEINALIQEIEKWD